MSVTVFIVYIGDVIQFSFTAADPDTGVPVDWTQYNTVQLVFMRPRDESVITVTPVAAVAGVASYTSTPGQLDRGGRWKGQLIGLVGGTPNGHSSIFEFDVEPPLA